MTPDHTAPTLDQHTSHEVNSRGNPICKRSGLACDFIVEEFEKIWALLQNISCSTYPLTAFTSMAIINHFMSALIQTIANLYNTCCHHQKQAYVIQEKDIIKITT